MPTTPTLQTNPMASLTPRGWLWLACVYFATAVGVQTPYFDCVHVWDDLRHLSLIGEAELGRISWIDFLSRYHNEHQLFVWKLWYIGCWSAFGLNPVGWHVCIAFAQAAAGVSIFGIASGVGVPRVAAVMTGFFWSAASFGGFDNPLIWIAASHLAFGFTWLLLASWVAVAGIQFPGYMRPVLTCGLLFCSFLTMSAMVIPSIMIPLLLLPAMKSLGTKLRVAWLLSWLLPLIAIIGLQFLVMLETPQTAEHGSRQLSRVPTLMVSAYGGALARLVAGDISIGTDQSILACLIGFSLIYFCSRPCRHLLLAVGIATAAYTLIVTVARCAYPPEFFITLTRFQYLAAFFWCVTLGTATGAAWRYLGQYGREAATVFLAVVGLLYLSLQFRQATFAKADFSELSRPSYEPWLENQMLLDELGSQTKRLADFPVTNRSFAQSLSGFASYCNFRKADVTPIHLLRIADIDEIKTCLSKSKNPQSARWQQTLEMEVNHRNFFTSLASIADSNQSIPLPQLLITLPTTSRISLLEWQRYCAPDLNHRFMGDQSRTTQSDWLRLVEDLGKVSHPLARELEPVVRECARDTFQSGHAP